MGQMLLPVVQQCEHVQDITLDSEDLASGVVKQVTERFSEADRSRQPSVMSLVRVIIAAMFSDVDGNIGLYGAFAYDLAYQFEPVTLARERDPKQRDIALFLPDELVLTDRGSKVAYLHSYEFSAGELTTASVPRQTVSVAPFVPAEGLVGSSCDHAPGEYAAKVALAKEKFVKGDLFEAVLSQTFTEAVTAPPSVLFEMLQKRNPAPFGFIISLGDQEWLVGASPEMYVRVQGGRVETCPISGTIPRGRDPLEDAQQVRTLLNSAKDESELTMCTDVDRNDKSRICLPGSVKVLGRRQIEMYSKLIHTVDHVEGQLKPNMDALDAFLAHTWAVTVTGAPKVWAIQFVEDTENSNRKWYAGAVGHIGFDGNMNTGLTLRTIHIDHGVASVRAGATLLYHSDPEAEEAECRLKASAFLGAIRDASKQTEEAAEEPAEAVGTKKLPQVLLVDHDDSFVHTLGNYFLQIGCELTTLRAKSLAKTDESLDKYDFAVLSPGPGCPEDFGLNGTIERLIAARVPIFGVCLGLQGMVEFFGGKLSTLEIPMHGQQGHAILIPEAVQSSKWKMFDQMQQETQLLVARYHSLYAKTEDLPDCLQAQAYVDTNVVMAIEHRTLPIAAVQFHPESILTLEENGLQLVRNVVTNLTRAGYPQSSEWYK